MRKNGKGTIAWAERPRLRRAEQAVEVVYPTEGESVAPPFYTMQVAVAAAERAEGVEVCVDQGEWTACREALGLWWHDWRGFDAGEHVVVARMTRPGGDKVRSEPRLFVVA